MIRAAVMVAAAVLFTAACAPWQPVDGQGPRSGQETRPQPRAVQTPPTWYNVRRGDTLYSIAFRYGLDWRRVAAWNDIGAPFTIRPGQELRMSAPPQRSQPVEASNPPAPEEPVAAQSEPPADRPSDPAPQPPPEPPRKPESDPEPAAEPSPEASDRVRSAGGVTWQWPTEGQVARRFDPSDTRKGIGLAGEEGQAVRAAAAGQVVYSGTALIGYGELIIIKHSDTLLSAYGHNRRRLVGEGDRVQRGEKIAEMGLDDRQEERLHFEIRRDGEPVNPMDFLPRR